MRFLPKRCLLLLILECATVLSDVITEGFVRVTKYCPESLSAFGEILILADYAKTYPYALCRGREYSFVQICPGVYRLRFRHSGDPNEDCLSTLLIREDYYAAQVNIPVHNELVTIHMETQIVRCPIKFHRPPSGITFSNSKDLIFQTNKSIPAQNQSDFNDLQLLSDVMMNSERPEPEAVRISIQVHEVDNSTNVAKLQIYSLMNNPHIGITGVSPIKCNISYNSEVQVIIDNGCSNGSVIPIHTGFTVQGIMSWSPVFLFPIPSGGLVLISCSFGICKNNCDGSSCRHHKIEILDVYTSSAKVFLTSPHEDVRGFVPNSKDGGLQVIPGLRPPLIPGLRPPLENDPIDEDDTTTRQPKSYTVTLNVPLIIALSVLLPIITVLLIIVCCYKSRMNSGAYRVRNRANL